MKNYEKWNGIHTRIIAPKGSFKKIYNDLVLECVYYEGDYCECRDCCECPVKEDQDDVERD